MIALRYCDSFDFASLSSPDPDCEPRPRLMPTATAAATTKIAAAIVSTLPALLFVEFFDPFVSLSVARVLAFESFGGSSSSSLRILGGVVRVVRRNCRESFDRG